MGLTKPDRSHFWHVHVLCLGRRPLLLLSLHHNEDKGCDTCPPTLRDTLKAHVHPQSAPGYNATQKCVIVGSLGLIASQIWGKPAIDNKTQYNKYISGFHTFPCQTPRPPLQTQRQYYKICKETSACRMYFLMFSIILKFVQHQKIIFSTVYFMGMIRLIIN